jgi:hypothetical protein
MTYYTSNCRDCNQLCEWHRGVFDGYWKHVNPLHDTHTADAGYRLPENWV